MCCEGRDCKSLYNLSRMGMLKGFTRVNDPQEMLENLDTNIEATNVTRDFILPNCMAHILIIYLELNGFFRGQSVDDAKFMS